MSPVIYSYLTPPERGQKSSNLIKYRLNSLNLQRKRHELMAASQPSNFERSSLIGWRGPAVMATMLQIDQSATSLRAHGVWWVGPDQIFLVISLAKYESSSCQERVPVPRMSTRKRGWSGLKKNGDDPWNFSGWNLWLKPGKFELFTPDFWLKKMKMDI